MIEFVQFVALILKMRFTFYLIAQSIHQLETTFFNKIAANRIPNYKHIPISTLIIQLMNFTDYYLNKQLVQSEAYHPEAFNPGSILPIIPNQSNLTS